nr:MAG TPA: BppU domain protein [Caudoviricetes sp.]
MCRPQRRGARRSPERSPVWTFASAESQRQNARLSAHRTEVRHLVQGDSYNLSVTIKNKGQPLDIASVEKVEISLLYLQKSYPGEIGYEDGKFLFPLTQQETFRLPKLCQMQVRVKFKSGDVIGSEIKQIDVAHALSKAVL